MDTDGDTDICIWGRYDVTRGEQGSQGADIARAGASLETEEGALGLMKGYYFA